MANLQLVEITARAQVGHAGVMCGYARPHGDFIDAHSSTRQNTSSAVLMRKPYGARIHARRPSDDGRLRFRIVLGKLRAIICLHKKLGGTAFATPPYKTRGFFYLDSLCLTGTSRQSALPKKPWPIGWRHWRARDCSFRAASPRGPLDSMMCFSFQTPQAPAAYAGTSTWRSA